MSTLRILHAADLHLDAPYRSIPEEKAARLRKDRYALVQRLSALSVETGADLIFLPGDIFDRADCSKASLLNVERALSAAGCPVFIAPGNHDFYSSASPYTALTAADIHVFTENAVRCFELPELGARVFGAAFTDRSAPPLLRGFSAEKYDQTLNLLCIHGETGVPDSRYDPITEDELAASGMDYAALGHVHKPSGLRKSGSVSWSWPGCPEGGGFDETGERFVNLVEIDRDTRAVNMCQIPIYTHRFLSLEADISAEEPLLAVHRLLPDDSSGDICRILFTGETAEAPDLRRLRAELEGLFFCLQLEDGTRLPQNIWEKAGQNSLRGLFLQKLRAMYEKAEPVEQKRIEQAARWGLSALDGREGPDSDS